MQRQTPINGCGHIDISEHNLAFPLRRWQRNYIVALQIARLELENWKPIERADKLLDWMHEDFLIAGPAASFSMMYFAPNSSKKRLIKRLRSVDRTRALEGVANAAWDITYLSNFVERVAAGWEKNVRYIFATADRSLAAIASSLFASDPATGIDDELSKALLDWWPSREARALGAKISQLTELAESANRLALMRSRQLAISDLIVQGEQYVRSWRCY